MSPDYFDTVYDRHTAVDIKYQSLSGVGNVILMWIADMDFKAPPAVEEALMKSAKHGIFGYTKTDEEYDDLIESWYKKRMGWNITPEWILKAPELCSPFQRQLPQQKLLIKAERRDLTHCFPICKKTFGFWERLVPKQAERFR